ncbi:MAG: hypothetical protein K1W16_07975 [Lachnospiraceae bacterium]
MNEIYIEQISTVRAIRFEEEDSDKYSVPAGYYISRQSASQNDKEKLSNLSKIR